MTHRAKDENEDDVVTASPGEFVKDVSYTPSSERETVEKQDDQSIPSDVDPNHRERALM